MTNNLFIVKCGRKLLPIWLLLIIHSIHAQNTIGIPEIINYSNQTYNAGSQNWGVAQDKKGIIYFANNEGLLTFDGNFWRKYPLPNKTKVRSVAIDRDGRIYVGGQFEIGYFFPNGKGELVYTSLMPLIEKNGKDFTDVWNICFFQDRVFFRAYRKIFEYDGHQVITHDGIQWNFMGGNSSQLLALTNERKLLSYVNGKWITAAKTNLLPPNVVLRCAICIGQDSTMLVTQTSGLFIMHGDTITPFRTKDLNTISSYNIYGATLLGNNRIALNTNLAGCLIINKKGEFVQKISKREGIQNNNILCMLLDKHKNLWFGLDNGIDLVLYNNAIQHISPESEDRNAGYTSIVHNNKLYLGLVSGAYEVPLEKLDAESKDLSFMRASFKPLKGSKGQVWNFSVLRDQLLMGHNRGAFIINKDSAQLLDGNTGFWNFYPVQVNGGSHFMLAGNYNGINFYNYANQQFNNPATHAHFESARFVVQHKNNVWASHPFKGLYKVQYNSRGEPVVTSYDDKKKILSNNHNKVFKIWNKLILVTDKGLFEYKDEKSDFERSVALETFSHTAAVINYLTEDKYGNVWFTSDKRVGVLDRTTGKPKIVFIPELSGKIQANGFEHINVIDSNNVIITGENGFFHLNYAHYKNRRTSLQALVSRVSLVNSKDSLLYGGYAAATVRPAVRYLDNSIHFEVSTTSYGSRNSVEYSYSLEGFDKGWSEWSNKAEKDYTNLPEGSYTFKVKCRNNFDNESSTAFFSFTVLPPWYRTWWAYMIYAFVVTGALYLFYKRQQEKYKKQQQTKLAEQQRKYDEEQKRLQIEHQLSISENENKIAQLQQDRLLAEIGHKNTELASSAMNLVHKAELLSKLKADLIQLKEGAAGQKEIKEMQKIIKLIDAELDQTQDWEQFAHHFDNVHTDYLKKLKDHCPDLSTTELKLAAFLRLSLSSKEIAHLMNISIRGVETSRYRLRKKLGLTNEEANLYDYLIQITEEKPNGSN